MPTSKLQDQTRERLRILLMGYEVKENYYPEWLINPATGRRLELDFWLPDVKVAIEVQGIQHLKFTPFFHKTEDDFKAQLERDQYKREACKAQGVHLHEVVTYEDIDIFLEETKGHSWELARELIKKHTAIKSLSYYAAKMFIENNKKNPNNDRMAKLASRIVHIADKYQIPVKSIRPDFEVTKGRLAYINKPIAMAKLVENGEVIFGDKFVVVNMDEENDSIRMQPLKNRNGDGRQTEITLRLSTGLETVEGEKYWRLKYIRFPDDSRREYEYPE